MNKCTVGKIMIAIPVISSVVFMACMIIPTIDSRGDVLLWIAMIGGSAMWMVGMHWKDSCKAVDANSGPTCCEGPDCCCQEPDDPSNKKVTIEIKVDSICCNDHEDDPDIEDIRDENYPRGE